MAILQVVYVKGGVLEDTFTNGNGLERKVFDDDRFILEDSVAKAIDTMLMLDQSTAFLYQEFTVPEYIEDSQKCNVFRVKGCFSSDGMGLIMQKNYPYKGLIDYKYRLLFPFNCLAVYSTLLTWS